jgi:hypothetical protein
MPSIASNISITERPDIDAKGKQYTLRTVTYMVGAHGPFMITGASDQLTAPVIKQKIAAQVAEVDDIESIQTPPAPGY